MNLKESKILLLWGLTTFAGWIITSLGFYLAIRPFNILLAWAGFMAVPIVLTIYKYYLNSSNKLFDFWTLAVAFLMVENLFINRFLIFSYFTIWLLLGSAGYYYTSRNIPPPSENTYIYGAGLNLLATPMIYYLPLGPTALILAFVQAGPIFYDYWEVHM